MRKNQIRENAKLILEKFKDKNQSDIPDFSFISPALQGLAEQCWEQRDADGLMVLLDDDRRLFFIDQNIDQLKAKGIYEEALLNAWTSVKYTWLLYFDFSEIIEFFQMADPDKLRDAGDPIPDQSEFTLYRGVSGTGNARDQNGLSWTASPNVAAWYATRFDHLDDPAVYQATVPRKEIMAYINDRCDQTYLLLPFAEYKVKRLRTMPDAWTPPSFESSFNS